MWVGWVDDADNTSVAGKHVMHCTLVNSTYHYNLSFSGRDMSFTLTEILPGELVLSADEGRTVAPGVTHIRGRVVSSSRQPKPIIHRHLSSAMVAITR